MIYTIYVNKPRRHFRRKCRLAPDGRYILFEGEGSRHDVMKMAREASDHAESVHVVWKSTRSLQRQWSPDPVVSADGI